MRLGLSLGPLWAGTGARLRRRRSQIFHGVMCDEDGRAIPCHHNHRTHQAAQECSLREERRHAEETRATKVRLISGMSAEEYRRSEELLRAAEAGRGYGEGLRRLGAGGEAELRWYMLVLAEINFQCPTCGKDQFECVTREWGPVGIGARCTNCGARRWAREEPDW
jgi:hypothetical protein